MAKLQIQLFTPSVRIYFQGQDVDLRNIAGDQRKTSVDYAKILGLLIWRELAISEALASSGSALQFPSLELHSIRSLLGLEESTFDKQRKKLLDKLSRLTNEEVLTVGQVVRSAEIDLVKFHLGLRSGNPREMETALLFYEDSLFGEYHFNNQDDRVHKLRQYLDKRFAFGLFALQKAGYPFIATIVQQKEAQITASPYLRTQVRQRELLEYAKPNLSLESLAAARFATLIPDNFPPASNLVGRENETAIIREALASSRLVTLLGVGGVGKTSLAITVARIVIAGQENSGRDHRFADGIRFISLVQVTPMVRGEEEFAATLLAQFDIEKPQGSSLHALVHYLESRRMVIVFDNCEHVETQITSLVMQLLSRCPHLTLLTTSRIALNLPEENAITITPFSIPSIEQLPDVKSAQQYPAIIQFEHCRREKNDFSLTLDTLPLVAQICHHTSGIPLFILLAARRPEKLADIASSLSEFFDITGEEKVNALYRQDSPWDCILWSYGLISDDAKVLLRRLSLLGNEWDCEFCRSVCSAGFLGRFEMVLLELCGCCLVEPAVEQGRYRTLEPIRAFAERQLHLSEEADEIISLLEKRLQQENPVDDLLQAGIDQPSSAMQLQTTIAIAEVLWGNQATNPVLNFRIQIKASRARFLQGIINGTARCLPPITAFVDKAISLRERTDIHLVNAVFTFMAGEYSETLRHAGTGLSAAEKAGDPKRIALALSGLGITQAFLGMSEAIDNVEQGKKAAYLCRDQWAIALAHMSYGAFYWQSGSLKAAREDYEYALKNYYEIGDTVMIFLALNSLAHLACRSEGPQQAAKLYLDSISFSGANARGIAGCILGASGVAFQFQNYPVAAFLHGAGLKQYERIGASLIPPIQRDYTAEIATVKELLGIDRYAQSYSEGGRLSLAAAKTFAENYYLQICAET